MTKILKPYPKFNNADEEENFLDTANLEEYDLVSGGIPMKEWVTRWEQYHKDASMHLRLPSGMVQEMKQVAEKQKVHVQKLVRQYIERGLKEDTARKTAA